MPRERGRDGIVEIARAVVAAGKDVAVQVDHDYHA
jgi:hypothetical protein